MRPCIFSCRAASCTALVARARCEWSEWSHLTQARCSRLSQISKISTRERTHARNGHKRRNKTITSRHEASNERITSQTQWDGRDGPRHTADRTRKKERAAQRSEADSGVGRVEALQAVLALDDPDFLLPIPLSILHVLVLQPAPLSDEPRIRPPPLGSASIEPEAAHYCSSSRGGIRKRAGIRRESARRRCLSALCGVEIFHVLFNSSVCELFSQKCCNCGQDS